MNDNNNFKVFFLFPDFKIEELAKELLKNHYETYLVYNENYMIEYIKKYKDSVLFINIDQHFDDNKWTDYIKKIKFDEKLKNLTIAILTFDRKYEFVKSFLKLKIRLLYFKLNHRNNENYLLLKNFLNNFRSEVRIISVKCRNDIKFNIKINDKNPIFIKGTIKEISLTGMVCNINHEKNIDFYLHTDELINNIQLNLNYNHIIVSGYLFLRKEHIFIFKFSPITDHYKRDKLNNFIFQQLQNNLKRINFT